MKSILLIGLGRFGKHIAMKLRELNHQVMAVDHKEELVTCPPTDCAKTAQKHERGDAAETPERNEAGLQHTKQWRYTTMFLIKTKRKEGMYRGKTAPY